MSGVFLRPPGVPVKIRNAHPLARGLVGFWDLATENPVDITGHWGALTSGASYPIVGTPFGNGRANNLNGANNGLYVTKASNPIVNGSACSIMVVGQAGATSGRPMSTWMAALSGSSTGYFFGVDFNSSNQAYPANLNMHLSSAVNSAVALITSAASFQAGQMLHSIETLDAHTSLTVNQYTNGILDGSLALSADTFTGFDSMGIGCFVQPSMTGLTGTFTNGSPVFTYTSSFSTKIINTTISGLTGIPANTYITATNFNNPSKNYTMSNAFTGTTGSGQSFNISGTQGTGTSPQCVVAVWNRQLTAAEAVLSYTDPCGMVVYSGELQLPGVNP